MSSQEHVKGKLIRVEPNEGVTLESLCKRICKQKGIEELDEYTQTWEQGLLESFNEEYIIIDGYLYQYQDVIEERDEQDVYCLYKTPEGYGFDVNFHNGGCCLPEAIEYAYMLYKKNETSSEKSELSKEIKEKLLKLEALEVCGVANWVGYDYAINHYMKNRG